MPSNRYPRTDFTRADITRMLTVARDANIPCRNSYESGCRCPEHSGPAAVRPHAQTIGAHAHDLDVACDNSMTCECERCIDDRLHRVATIHVIRQPWEPLKRAA